MEMIIKNNTGVARIQDESVRGTFVGLGKHRVVCRDPERRLYGVGTQTFVSRTERVVAFVREVRPKRHIPRKSLHNGCGVGERNPHF
jgi:hypothetical protein